MLGGLEAIRVLQQLGYKPRRSIELVIFTAEEPTRFGIGCLGSRMMAGALSPAQALTLRDKEGRGLEELRKQAGFHGHARVRRASAGRFHQFIELHIEQGPILEQEGIDVGLVTHIAAPASMRILIEGEGGHAGANADAGPQRCSGGGRRIDACPEVSRQGDWRHRTVATVGVCEVFPGAVNSIPSRVRLETDIRDIDAARRDGVIETVRSQPATEVAQRRGVSIATEMVNADPPATCDPAILAALEEAAKAAGKNYKKMVSRAYHDSLFMARIAPVAMLFIPCRGGVSHRPDEYAFAEWIGGGVHVLARTHRKLAADRNPARRGVALQLRRSVVCYPSTCTAFAASPTMSAHAKTRIVGASVPRKEGVDKLLGRARYVDDIEREGMWHGATVRSAIPRGLIRSIDFDRRIDWSEFAIVTAADIPGQNQIQMIVADQPCLADGQSQSLRGSHRAARAPRQAQAARSRERGPHRVRSAASRIHDRRERDASRPIVWGADNCSKAFFSRKGDVDSAWASAAHMVEGEYRTGAQEHLYIENNGVIAEYSAEERRHRLGIVAVPLLRAQIA